MIIEKQLRARSQSCELCGAGSELAVYEVQPQNLANADENALLCNTCIEQLDDAEKIDPNHWRCLNDSMWNEVPAVQVLAWRMLWRLRAEGWPQDLLDMMYMDDERLAWAKATEANDSDEVQAKHTDSNGVELLAGDSVVLIKDLNVKGAGFTAKRGTAVRNISLVIDNPEHIEGRVNGQQIVILTKFVKKT